MRESRKPALVKTSIMACNGLRQNAIGTDCPNLLKQHRAVPTRYDKRRYVYLGTATAAALSIWRRT